MPPSNLSSSATGCLPRECTTQIFVPLNEDFTQTPQVCQSRFSAAKRKIPIRSGLCLLTISGSIQILRNLIRLLVGRVGRLRRVVIHAVLVLMVGEEGLGRLDLDGPEGAHLFGDVHIAFQALESF